jgi:hypothetical protein
MVPGTASETKLIELHQPVESPDAGGDIRIAKTSLVLRSMSATENDPE